LEFASEAIRIIEEQSRVETTTGVQELDAFASQGLITRVHATLTSGKEGTVYCCRAHPSTRRKFLAAKVYREHAASAHKWNQTYFEGRERVLEQKHIRAIHARTRYGLALARALWVSAEYETLRALHAAGADVPEPVAACGRTILMEYIGNGAGPAPQLRGVELSSAEAHDLFDQIMENVACMLRHHVVHGDLSPYNILVWKEQASIIDVPQAVDVRFNRSALDLLRRDVANVCAFFRRQGVDRDPDALTDGLWARYLRAEL
jgi:RIO kinase 1